MPLYLPFHLTVTWPTLQDKVEFLKAVDLQEPTTYTGAVQQLKIFVINHGYKWANQTGQYSYVGRVK